MTVRLAPAGQFFPTTGFTLALTAFSYYGSAFKCYDEAKLTTQISILQQTLVSLTAPQGTASLCPSESGKVFAFGRTLNPVTGTLAAAVATPSVDGITCSVDPAKQASEACGYGAQAVGVLGALRAAVETRLPYSN